MNTKKLALLGGKKIGPVSMDQHPTFSKTAIRRAAKLLEKGATVGLGKHHPIVNEAEESIARWQKVKHCMVVSSGHASLQIAILGLEREKELNSGHEIASVPEHSLQDWPS